MNAAGKAAEADRTVPAAPVGQAREHANAHKGATARRVIAAAGTIIAIIITAITATTAGAATEAAGARVRRPGAVEDRTADWHSCRASGR